SRAPWRNRASPATCSCAIAKCPATPMASADGPAQWGVAPSLGHFRGGVRSALRLARMAQLQGTVAPRGDVQWGPSPHDGGRRGGVGRHLEFELLGGAVDPDLYWRPGRLRWPPNEAFWVRRIRGVQRPLTHREDLVHAA